MIGRVVRGEPIQLPGEMTKKRVTQDITAGASIIEQDQDDNTAYQEFKGGPSVPHHKVRMHSSNMDTATVVAVEHKGTKRQPKESTLSAATALIPTHFQNNMNVVAG